LNVHALSSIYFISVHDNISTSISNHPCPQQSSQPVCISAEIIEWVLYLRLAHQCC